MLGKIISIYMNACLYGDVHFISRPNMFSIVSAVGRKSESRKSSMAKSLGYYGNDKGEQCKTQVGVCP